MTGIYFSGTGNTKHCVERFARGTDESAELVAIEDSAALDAIKRSDVIIFGYPVYYSNLPKIVKDFILDNAEAFKGKKIIVIATMGLFSGDGAGCAARMFKKCGATVLGGLHIKMPDCIGDVKLLKKPLEKNRDLVAAANKKIDTAVECAARGKYPKEGLNIFYHIAGLFGQRLYFFNKTARYYKKIKADDKKCEACGLCAQLCPMKNIALKDGRVEFQDRCTMCYRCFSVCPQRAITILGDEVYEQCRIDKYL